MVIRYRIFKLWFYIFVYKIVSIYCLLAFQENHLNWHISWIITSAGTRWNNLYTHASASEGNQILKSLWSFPFLRKNDAWLSKLHLHVLSEGDFHFTANKPYTHYNFFKRFSRDSSQGWSFAIKSEKKKMLLLLLFNILLEFLARIVRQNKEIKTRLWVIMSGYNDLWKDLRASEDKLLKWTGAQQICWI